MKKLLSILIISFNLISLSAKENAKPVTDERQTFIGIDGGIGLYMIGTHGIIPFGLFGLGPKFLSDSMGYHLGLSIGSQYYYKPNRGKRFILSLRMQYASHYKDYDNTSHYPKDPKQQRKFPIGVGYGFSLSLSQDLLLDFSATDDKRHGIVLGYGLEIADFQFFPKLNSYIIGHLTISARLGYKYQNRNDIFEITLEAPVAGLLGTNFNDTTMHILFNPVLVLSYKYIL